MTIPERISTLVRANINDLLDHAEDPEKVIKQLLTDMHSQRFQARTRVAMAIADQKRLYARYQDAQAQADAWERRAVLAVDKDDDDLARQALMRRSAFQQTASDFQEQYDEQSHEVSESKDSLAQLEVKIDEAEARKDLLVVRSRRARAETEIRVALSGQCESGALASFERVQTRVDEQESRAAAFRELEASSVDERFAALESGEQVERDLAELKASTKRSGLPAPERVS